MEYAELVNKLCKWMSIYSFWFKTCVECAVFDYLCHYHRLHRCCRHRHRNLSSKNTINQSEQENNAWNMRNERLKREKKIMLIFFLYENRLWTLSYISVSFGCCENKETLWHVQWKRITAHTHKPSLARNIVFFTQQKKKSFTFGIPCERLTHIRTTVRAREEANKGVIDEIYYNRGMSAFCGFCWQAKTENHKHNNRYDTTSKTKNV